MDNRFKKFLRNRIFNKNDPHMYIVIVDIANGTLKDIYVAPDIYTQDRSIVDGGGGNDKKLYYFEVKKEKNNEGSMFYYFRTINKMPTSINFKYI
ncbi:hypothetical protein [Alphabaculovirus myunipunctae]|uniref:Uncharacterized protein n=1 Tax=Mythimna unipuncta nucleopolyhedrovirus TaxID=447897 RepID=A0A2K9VSG7_9ABAC|nr:hypothetical protein [Mythimna unipuncta nucleopolyhedrovirus]AUV65407.1 hypothetical protein [Mythimna unipuncta nucleopolyhedrovirus]